MERCDCDVGGAEAEDGRSHHSVSATWMYCTAAGPQMFCMDLNMGSLSNSGGGIEPWPMRGTPGGF